jgi:hypothetical protein
MQKKESVRGLENVKERKLRPAREFFDEFGAAHGISLNIANK